MTKLTKIVATIGPASDSEEKISELIRAGVNVFRFNMKHNSVNWHEERIRRVQKIADSLKTPIGILIDLQGPELRLETLNAEKFPVKKNEQIIFTPAFLPRVKSICVPHAAFFEACVVGTEILIDDGFLEFKVTECGRDRVIAISMQDGLVGNRKAVNLPGRKIKLEALIADDLARLDMASRNKVDFVALSFCRNKHDIEILKEQLVKRKIHAQVVAKIESQEALDNLNEIIEAADSVMIARGDLGIEVPIQKLAYWQKNIIQACREAKKPVITATQMLQSMVENPKPTRAEATDVANAVFDGTDAVMLSAESASGRYPVAAVSAMAQIAAFNEKITNLKPLATPPAGRTQLIVDAAAHLIKHQFEPKIDVLIVFTETGWTARALAALRPKLPVFVISECRTTVEGLTLVFGVNPFCLNFKTAVADLKKQRLLKSGQHVLLIHGRKWRTPGLTNTLAVQKIK
jgi:pyruvate kinase